MLSRHGRKQVRVTLLRMPSKSRENRCYSLVFDHGSLPPIRSSCFHRSDRTVDMHYYGMDTEKWHDESRAYVLTEGKTINLAVYDPVYAFVQIEDAYLKPALHRGRQ